MKTFQAASLNQPRGFHDSSNKLCNINRIYNIEKLKTMYELITIIAEYMPSLLNTLTVIHKCTYELLLFVTKYQECRRCGEM